MTAPASPSGGGRELPATDLSRVVPPRWLLPKKATKSEQSHMRWLRYCGHVYKRIDRAISREFYREMERFRARVEVR